MSELSSTKNQKMFQNQKTYLKRSRSTEKAHIRFCGFDRDQSSLSLFAALFDNCTKNKVSLARMHTYRINLNKEGNFSCQ